MNTGKSSGWYGLFELLEEDDRWRNQHNHVRMKIAEVQTRSVITQKVSESVIPAMEHGPKERKIVVDLNSIGLKRSTR